MPMNAVAIASGIALQDDVLRRVENARRIILE